MMASEGYPGPYKKGIVIKNIDEAEQVSPAVKIFHAGTTFDTDGNFVAAGGRVLGVTAKGKDIEEARAKAGQKDSTGMILVGGRSNIGVLLHTDDMGPLNLCNYVGFET
jgi:phosphoribosylamine-glycine ligase